MMLQEGKKEGREERRQRKARQEPATGQGDAGNRWCLESTAEAASLAEEKVGIFKTPSGERRGEDSRSGTGRGRQHQQPECQGTEGGSAVVLGGEVRKKGRN